MTLRERRRSTERERRTWQERLDETREQCKTFRGFVRAAWHVLEPTTRFIHSWHNDAIADHMEAVHRGEIQRLQINQPPGTMKSLTASVMFPAWEWTLAPGIRYLTTSYKEDYARRDSRRHRDLVLHEWYQAHWPHVQLARDNEMDFETTARGGRRAAPFASLTAGRGNRVIVDDPHSTEQVESDADRERAARIYRESVTSRLNDPVRDAIIVIMHRLHPEDICGVIETIGVPYVKLVLPMEYVRSTTITTRWFKDPRTDDGELLCPERVPRETVEALKIELGPHAYDTQCMQMPRAREGSYFFNREHILLGRPAPPPREGLVYEPVDYPINCDGVIAVIDTATKTGKKRDGTGIMWTAYTRYPEPSAVILDWDIIQIEASLLEVWLPGQLERAEELARMCGARAGSLGAFIEDKDSGQILLQQATRRGLNAHAIDSTLVAAGKDGRAISVSGYVYKSMILMSRFAYDKTTVYKGKNRNHALHQITGFRMGAGTSDDDDELFDDFCYTAAILFGDVDMH